MNRERRSVTSMLAPILRRALTSAAILFAGLIAVPGPIVAQGSFQAGGQFTPSFGRADSLTGATSAPLFSSSGFQAMQGTGPGTSSFGMYQAPSIAISRDLFVKPLVWNHGLLEPSQPRAGIGGFGGSAAGSIGFPGLGRQQGSGFNSFTSGGLGSPQGNFSPLFFPVSGTLTRAQAFGTVQGTSGMLPRFDSRIAGSVTLPLNSPVGSFRMSYRDMFSDGRNAMGTNFATGPGSATFGTSSLGNGMFLSAGSSYGMRSTAGSAGSAAPVGPKHSSSTVGLKLTF